MMKIMKVLSLFAFLFLLNVNDADASSLTQEEEIERINEELPNLVDEVNSNLESGKAGVASTTLENGSTLTIGVGPSLSKSFSLNKTGTLATTSTQKNYTAYIGYDGAGFNFSHKIDGTYKVSSGKVTNVTYDVTQKGWVYSKSHNTVIQEVDNSVKIVNSIGYFNTPFYVQYLAYLNVTIYGSGDYRITKAQITN